MHPDVAKAVHAINRPSFPERPIQRGHDPYSRLQHAEDNQGQCHDKGLGYWRSTAIPGDVGAILSGRECHCVRSIVI